VIAPVDPRSPEALAVLSAYWRELVTRWQGRPATDDDVGATLRAWPSDDLVAPAGILLLARDADGPVGCAGARWRPGGVAELVRVAVLPRARRRGWGRALIDGIEDCARRHGCTTARLEVRGDLHEAQALYRACGYAEVPAFSDGPYADVHLAKALPR
jgi:ribosomal protein S18 acetylase RimI-like enzyme